MNGAGHGLFLVRYAARTHRRVVYSMNCKGCRKDCPVDVDMATYQAEFLAHHYRGRPRPASHYSMGWLPVLALLAARAPQAVNAAGRAPGLGRLLKLAGGIDTQRELPRSARQRFTRWHARREPHTTGTPGCGLAGNFGFERGH